VPDDTYLLKDFGPDGQYLGERPQPAQPGLQERERMARLEEIRQYYLEQEAELEESRMLDPDRIGEQYRNSVQLDAVRRGAHAELGGTLHRPDDQLSDGRTPVVHRTEPNPTFPGARGTTFLNPGHLSDDSFSDGGAAVALKAGSPGPARDMTRYHESRHVEEGLGRPPRASSAPYPDLPPASQRLSAANIEALTEHYDGILAERYRNLSASEQAVYRAVKAGKGAAGLDLQRGAQADPHEYHNRVMDHDILRKRGVTRAEADRLEATPEGQAKLERLRTPR
jgi:hypothetical protein